MECILLGTGGMMPMPSRLLTSLAVRFKGRIYLFDAGEGTQLGWKKAHLGVRGMEVIAVTHLHADHCLGLPGLLMLKAQMEQPRPVTILGPPGIEAFVRAIQSMLQFVSNYPLHFAEWSPVYGDLAYEDESVRIFWRPLEHTRFCLGYRVEERERPGKFSADRARDLKIPEGPLWGRLQRGETVVGHTGEEIKPQQVLGPPRRGRQIAFVVDTRPHDHVEWLCRGADLAFIEGMFLPEDAEHAGIKGHMTVIEAARCVEQAKAGRAIWVHLSPRYEESDLDRFDRIGSERSLPIRAGRDLEVFAVPLPD